MSAEITPAVERITDVLIEHRDIVCVTGDPDVVAYDILDHALSVDEIAPLVDPTIVEPLRSRVMSAWRSAGLDAEKYMAESEARATERAAALRTALLGADS